MRGNDRIVQLLTVIILLLTFWLSIKKLVV